LNRLNVRRTITFAAPRFQTHVALQFITAYTDAVIIREEGFWKALERILLSSGTLGSHADVLVGDVNKITRELTCNQFTWGHSQYKPYGKSITADCGKCHAIRSWEAKSVKKKGVYTIQLRCKSPSCTSVRELSKIEDTLKTTLAYFRKDNESETWFHQKQRFPAHTTWDEL
jgi:hypothetical protein